ncbi:MAG: hypothetical protein GWO22_42315, partial [Actinobacteria bacterium]|nr:hypothetical protein [Actinomycetota bacterium]
MAESFDDPHSAQARGPMAELDHLVATDDDQKVAGLAFVGRATLLPKRQQLER